MNVSKRIVGIELSIRKISDMAASVPGCVRFDIGQPDFKTPRNICDAAVRAIKDGYHGYTPVTGIAPLRQAIADYEMGKGIDVYDKNVMVTMGGMGAIFTIVLGFLEPSDEVVFPDPTWPPYKLIVSSVGGVAKLVPYFDDSGALDVDAISNAVTSRTKFVVVNTPENPTGRVIGKNDLQAIAQVCEDKGVMIISDEVYDRILFDGARHVSIKKYAGDNAILVNSVSKTYAMTGWRVGWMVASEEIIGQLMKCNRASVACPNSVSQYAALEALTGAQTAVDKMVSEYGKRKNLVVKLMDKMSWDYVVPHGAFYAFPKVCDDSWKYTLALMEKGGVSVVPGLPSGPSGEGYVRFCFGAADCAQIREGFERIEKFEDGS
ncbi:MAG: pyridoxal phosphate-dependent aminotransferase [Candidatus Nanohalarchaeota archaeon]|nr:MAG: pyridoxal phosphate-dependent aminotransferase [Candidatus Nanohaloarchaeota archaeon]